MYKGRVENPPLRLSYGILTIFLKNQFIIAGFGIFFHINGNTGKFRNYQFTGGVDDTAGAEVAADGGEVFFGQGNVQMTPGFTDGTVEADDLTMLRNIPDGNAAGIPDSSFGNAANSRQHHTCSDVLFFAQSFDGQHQIISPAQAHTVASHFT